MSSAVTSWRSRLEQPVAPYSLAFFRIAFGLLIAWDVVRYFANGWIHRHFLLPEFLFKYYGFEWAQPLPGDGMYWLFAGLGVLSILITLGLFYRLAIFLFLLCFSYVFVMDQARYLNHFYLVIVITFLMCLVPANHAWSLDARRRGQLRAVPQWSVWSMMLLFEVVLLYAGIVKINADWLQGRPLSMWFSDRGDIPLIGPLISGDWAIYAASYGSIILHICGAPLLFWKRTRIWVFAVYCIFHFTNAIVFHIGIFPWMTIAGTLIFFSPDWPKLFAERFELATFPEQTLQAPNRTSTITLAIVALFLVFQTLFPLRHYLYPGDVAWTEEGHRFAWRMKLRSKNGHANFHITDPVSGKTWKVKPEDYLTQRQTRYIKGRPDMILQFAHYLEEKWRQEHHLKDVEVRASIWCSLNGHPHRLLIDPGVDLTKVERELWPAANWILPRPSF